MLREGEGGCSEGETVQEESNEVLENRFYSGRHRHWCAFGCPSCLLACLFVRSDGRSTVVTYHSRERGCPMPPPAPSTVTFALSAVEDEYIILTPMERAAAEKAWEKEREVR